MITCQHARQLFDSYLDGELSPSLQAELHAHQLSCSACQNELAMLEACGDVVALDHCEPRLSDSFTDRVLLARRAQLARRPRRWGRALVLVGSPMAAAASILLTLMLVIPPASQIGATAVLGGGGIEAAPELVQKALGGAGNRTEQEKRELEQTPKMPAGFVEVFMAKLVEQTQDGVEGARSSVAELGLLLRQGFSEAHAKLAAQRGGVRSQRSMNEKPSEGPLNDFDFLRPPYAAPDTSTVDELSPDAALLDPL